MGLHLLQMVQAEAQGHAVGRAWDITRSPGGDQRRTAGWVHRVIMCSARQRACATDIVVRWCALLLPWRQWLIKLLRNITRAILFGSYSESGRQAYKSCSTRRRRRRRRQLPARHSRLRPPASTASARLLSHFGWRSDHAGSSRRGVGFAVLAVLGHLAKFVPRLATKPRGGGLPGRRSSLSFRHRPLGRHGNPRRQWAD